MQIKQARILQTLKRDGMRGLLYTDGACTNNNQRDLTKRQMTASVVSATGEVLTFRTEQGGSNNIAELLAVRDALQWAVENGYCTVQIRTDSQNNLRWVEGNIGFDVNDRERALRIYEEITALRLRVRMQLLWVPRRENVA